MNNVTRSKNTAEFVVEVEVLNVGFYQSIELHATNFFVTKVQR